jgi:hypothetical protein
MIPGKMRGSACSKPVANQLIARQATVAAFCQASMSALRSGPLRRSKDTPGKSAGGRSKSHINPEVLLAWCCGVLQA